MEMLIYWGFWLWQIIDFQWLQMHFLSFLIWALGNMSELKAGAFFFSFALTKTFAYICLVLLTTLMNSEIVYYKLLKWGEIYEWTNKELHNMKTEREEHY